MALSAFDDKATKPRQSDLEKMLGRTHAHWQGLVAHLAGAHAPLDKTWNFAGAKWGWSHRVKHKKRTILYMTPCKRHFLVGFVLGGKAVQAAHDSALPDSVLAIIDAAPKYAEGTGFRMEIRNKKDLENAKKLAAIKMAN